MPIFSFLCIFGLCPDFSPMIQFLPHCNQIWIFTPRRKWQVICLTVCEFFKWIAMRSALKNVNWPRTVVSNVFISYSFPHSYSHIHILAHVNTDSHADCWFVRHLSLSLPFHLACQGSKFASYGCDANYIVLLHFSPTKLLFISYFSECPLVPGVT